MSLPKLRQKIDFRLRVRSKGEFGISNANVDVPNPLRSRDSISWFKNKGGKANPDYSDTVHDRMIVHELKRLFERFDVDKSGTIDLDELGLMFETAGLIIDC